MKTLLKVIGTIGFLIALLFAKRATGAEISPVSMATATTIAEEFKAGEFGIDAGYRTDTETFGDFEGSTYLGGNYWVVKGAGLHAGLTGSDDNFGNAVKSFEFGLNGRLPYKSIALELGVGAEFELKPDEWSVYAETGPRFRFFKHYDLFAKVRGERPIKSSAGESVGLIGGIGATF